jgi:phage replication-related protein YjqB (UPF0714/DUF867 family)
MRRRDAYPNFEALQRGERRGIDYRIIAHRRAAPVAIIAPHGGRIEHGTCRIAHAIAGDGYSLYCFQALKAVDSGRLHITSTHFDEPTAVAMVTNADYVVAVHGMSSDQRFVYMGGLDERLRKGITATLAAAGFATESSGRMHLQGTSPHNICNRGRRDQGAQLEISRGLRKELTHPAAPKARLHSFAAAVRQAIAQVAGI